MKITGTSSAVSASVSYTKWTVQPLCTLSHNTALLNEQSCVWMQRVCHSVMYSRATRASITVVSRFPRKPGELRMREQWVPGAPLSFFQVPGNEASHIAMHTLNWLVGRRYVVDRCHHRCCHQSSWVEELVAWNSHPFFIATWNFGLGFSWFSGYKFK